MDVEQPSAPVEGYTLDPGSVRCVAYEPSNKTSRLSTGEPAARRQTSNPFADCSRCPTLHARLLADDSRRDGKIVSARGFELRRRPLISTPVSRDSQWSSVVAGQFIPEK